jgi:ribosome-associated heat shock protein Hsp15
MADRPHTGVAPQSVRLDKWLWAARIFKTRTQAADACRNGRVTIGGQPVKPSREVKIGDVILSHTDDFTRTIKVIALLERRVGGAAAKEFAEDLTPPSEYEKRRQPVLQPLFFRPKGMGRPTKKDRRAMGKLGEGL